VVLRQRALALAIAAGLAVGDVALLDPHNDGWPDLVTTASADG
jgi:hypothetical protein